MNLTKEERDAIMTLIVSVERMFEDDVPQEESEAIAILIQLIERSK